MALFSASHQLLNPTTTIQACPPISPPSSTGREQNPAHGATLRLLPAIQECTTLRQLKQVHSRALRAHLLGDAVVAGKLVSLAGVLGAGDLRYASLLFDQIEKPSLFAWNSMIRAFAWSQTASGCAALSFFLRMQAWGVEPNKHSYTFALMACIKELALSEGMQIHGRVLKCGLGSDKYIQNNLIRLYCSSSRLENACQVFGKMSERDLVSATSMADGYVKSGRMAEARNVFDSIEMKDEVLWTVMISGYAQNDRPSEALRLFREMLRDPGLSPTESTLVSVLSACAQLGAIESGRWIHWYMRKQGIKPTIKVATALVDMYSKCGMIEFARKIFDGIPQPDVIAWNAMIAGLALQGDGRSALELFSRMEVSGTWPNESTYVAVLSACNHAGMVEEGRAKFERMKVVDGIEPRMNHYGCMVDILGRSGRLDEAEELIKAMPIEPDDVIWRSLLDGCRSKKDVRRAELAMSKLSEMGCSEPTDYIILANLYASMGRYDDAGSTRRLMKDRGIEKNAGCSWIEVGGVVHMFVAFDKSHLRSDEMYFVLNTLVEEMKD
ncbi:pentatricopeptide repeat-containing protein At5g48910-like [Nymphaea colorata]|nr:pentatricopeptide repeat-containing protein At5g48910-like [Nymphaea colorata]